MKAMQTKRRNTSALGLAHTHIVIRPDFLR